MDRTEIPLPGFIGDLPLGFLAAMGLLQVLDRQRCNWRPRLRWARRGYWRAVLDLESPVATLDQVIEAAWEGMESSKSAILAFAESAERDLKLSREEVRRELLNAQESPSTSILAWMVAELPEEDGVAARSKLQLLNGAGHQHFLPALATVTQRVDRSHLGRTLLSSAWTYEEESRGGLSLGLDAADNRNHALLAGDPNSLPLNTELAAVRFAFEAFSLFPVFPGGRGSTTGFHRAGRATMFRWPIWECRLMLDEISVLITQSALADPVRYQERLRNLGVATVFEAERLMIGKGRTLLGPAYAYPL